MPSVLVKRKSRKAQEPAISEEEAQAIFRRHFEAQFAPLPETKKPKVAEPKAEEVLEDDAEVDSDWDGVSADEAEQAIEVVDHTDSKPHDPTAGMTKRQLKAFMSSRPPTQTDKPPPPPAKPSPSDEPDESTLRAQDIALQRLLSESHLLASLNPTTASTAAAAKPFAAGKLRQRTTDLRIQSLAAAGAPLAKQSPSLFTQAKMPMAMRKRITATRDAREDKRRREARENGVVLERVAPVKKADKKGRHERALDGPEVGRMRGAELKLSDRDVRNIEGSGGGRGGRGGKSGGRGRRGR
ncbi:hypothetical protein HYQ45_009793 [Verticillium longisporum]|uniref:Uncharacterized protein n=1 Tax=Verticillium longisporum TaxID=100787 RepID=A0A8I3ARS9_VERLO|nr:hypothetical protein HYQ45_009793 [Verticillium longisporum]